MASDPHPPILQVEDLHVAYKKNRKYFETVKGVSFHLEKGHTLGIVGETGAGKSSVALALMRLFPGSGTIRCKKMAANGIDIMKLKRKELERFRGNEVSMIFQDPMSSLNPVFTVGSQIADAIRLHRPLSRAEAWKEAGYLLEKVGIPAARAVEYPHEFSGGMKQRVMIAIALSCDPSVLIADEPTTALDVTIQAQILALMKDRQEESGMGILLITHDLGVAAEMCDEIAVMYAGRIVEYGRTDDIFNHFRHPYTEGLFGALPDIRNPSRRLIPIPGSIPDPDLAGDGCAFKPRCPYAFPECEQSFPGQTLFSGRHTAACHAYKNPEFKIRREV